MFHGVKNTRDPSTRALFSHIFSTDLDTYIEDYLNKFTKIVTYIMIYHTNLLNGYIHRYWTGPAIFASYVNCTGKCSMELKIQGTKMVSNLHSIIGISVSILYMSFVVIDVDVNVLKKILNSVNASHTCCGNISRDEIGISLCIKT